MVLKGILYSTIAGMATSLGALPFLFLKPHHTSDKVIDSFLGFAAGVMLAASAFSLVAPSLEMGGIVRFLIGFVLSTSQTNSFPTNICSKVTKGLTPKD